MLPNYNKYLSHFGDEPIYQSENYFNKSKHLYDAVETCIRNGVEIHKCSISEHTINIVIDPQMKPNEIKFINNE